jgi:hypothetical protein
VLLLSGTREALEALTREADFLVLSRAAYGWEATTMSRRTWVAALVMSRIALWGPIIPIGLGCATLSSAIGSILVAPRTMQALGRYLRMNLRGMTSSGGAPGR